MTSEMVERVARALALDAGVDWDGDVADTENEFAALRVIVGRSRAIAAIKAMREPTEAMIDAANGPDWRVIQWQNMIDAALGEPNK